MVEFWTALGAIGTCVTSLLLLITAVLLRNQVLEAKRQRHSQAYFRIADFLMEGDTRRARRRILELGQKAYGQWSDDNMADGELVCQTYSVIGAMVANKLVPPDWVLSRWSYSIRTCHQNCLPLIHDYRRVREVRGQWREFDSLAKMAAADLERRRLLADSDEA